MVTAAVSPTSSVQNVRWIPHKAAGEVLKPASVPSGAAGHITVYPANSWIIDAKQVPSIVTGHVFPLAMEQPYVPNPN